MPISIAFMLAPEKKHTYSIQPFSAPIKSTGYTMQFAITLNASLLCALN